MNNVFDDMRAAVRQAEDTLRAADNVAHNMASMLRGRLRHVDNHWALAALKAELANYNVRTRTWKE